MFQRFKNWADDGIRRHAEKVDFRKRANAPTVPADGIKPVAGLSVMGVLELCKGNYDI
jgi:hypothetical protein